MRPYEITINEIARLPSSEISDSTIARALEVTNEHLVSLGRRPEADYKSAVLASMRHNGAFILRVNPYFVDKDIIAEMNVGHLPRIIRDKGPEAYSLFTQDQIDKCVHQDINDILKLDPAYVSDDLLKEVIKGKPDRSAAVMEKAGRRNVISELISEGYWPSYSSGVPKKPGNLEDTIKLRLSKKWDDNEAMWLNALIGTYPQDEVFPLMKTTSRRKVLLEVYDREVLLRDHKHDKKLMGMLLEDELGI